MPYLGSSVAVHPLTQTLWETEEYWNDIRDEIVIVWIRNLGVKPKADIPTD